MDKYARGPVLGRLEIAASSFDLLAVTTRESSVGRTSDGLDADGADLELGDFGDGVQGGDGQAICGGFTIVKS